MKLKNSFVLTFLLLSIVLSGCIANPGTASINCAGFVINATVYNSSGGSGVTPVEATDSQGNIIFDGNVGPSIPDGATNMPVTLASAWTTKPAAGTISVTAGHEAGTQHTYTGTCDPNGNNAPPPLFTDGRINPDPAATVVGYCNPDHSITIYAKVSGEWYKVATFTPEQIRASLAKAQENQKHERIGEASGQELWALSSNELQFHDAMGVEYNYRFPANYCGG